MNTNIRFILFIALIGSHISCGLRTVKDEQLEAEAPSIKDIVAALNVNSSKISSIDGEARIAIDTGDMAQLGTTHINMIMPYMVEMSIRGPLGIPIAEVSVDTNHYKISDYLRQYFYEGVPTDLTFMGIPFNAGLQEFLELLSGVLSVQDTEIDSIRNFKIDGNKYFFEISNNGVLKSNWVDKETFLITKQVITFTNKTYKLEKIFEDIETINGINMPRFIHIFSDDLGGSLSLEYLNRDVTVTGENIP